MSAPAIFPASPLASDPAVLDAWEREVNEIVSGVFRPAPRLTGSEWADQHGYTELGEKWDTARVPFLREIMDAISDRTVREVVVMKPSRVGYTIGILGQRVGYVIDHDPAPILIVQPTVDDAKDWSQKQLTPMLDATPVLRERVKEKRSRDSGNTILDKLFPGGSITIRGAHSPKGLRRTTARDVILDEVDGFEMSSGSNDNREGDPVMLAVRACRTFPDRKVVMGSTPKLLHSSRILKALKASDWREYHVVCPHCSEYQVLKWGGPDVKHGIKWARKVTCRSCGHEPPAPTEKCAACNSAEWDVEHLYATAHYVCEHCGDTIEEFDKPDLLASGRWVPKYPGRAARGFAISGLMSPFEGASWSEMVRVFLESKDDPAMLQVWVNQWLGEPFEERGEKVDATTIEGRAVIYTGVGGEIVEVPDGVGVLTAGVDVQGDRLEMLVRGYGGSRTSWDIFHERIYGLPHHGDTWGRLDFLLARTFRHASGRPMRIQATMIDSGGVAGTTQAVYAFVQPRQARNIWAAKGDKGAAGAPAVTGATRKTTGKVILHTLGTYTLKSDLFSRLKVQRPGLPGYVYLRKPDSDLCNGFDAEYFAQFGAEQKQPVRVTGSRTVEYRFVQIRKRNEAIDLHCLADAAFIRWGGPRMDMAEWAEHARVWVSPAEPEKEAEPRRAAEPDERGDWATGGRWGGGWGR